MTDVFISYSRRDKVFTQKLVDALQAAKREVWADWASIPAASDWDAEIKEGIEKTNTVLFLLSPEWIKSNECHKEMVHAIQHGKRLVPILHIMPAQGQEVPPELAKLNWVYMRETDDFDKAFETLQGAMDTDLDWAKTHTRIQVRAIEWDKKNRDNSFTLRGKDLTDGEQFISGATGKSPEPTQLQGEYVLASRKDATRRQRITLAGVTIALVVSVALGIVAYFQRQAAVLNSKIAFARELTVSSQANIDSDPERSILLALQAVEITTGAGQGILPQTEDALRTAVQASRVRHTEKIGEDERVLSVSFSQKGDKLAVGTGNDMDGSGKIIIWNISSVPNHVDFTQEHVGVFTFEQAVGIQIPAYNVKSVDFNNDGTKVATSSDENGRPAIWDATTGEKLIVLDGDMGEINKIAYSPNGQMMVTAGADGFVRMWDANTGEMIWENSDHSYNVKSVSFSPTGDAVVSAGDSGLIIFSNARTGETLNYYEDGVLNIGVNFSPDGNMVSILNWDYTVRLLDSSINDVTVFTKNHKELVQETAFNKDGSILISVALDGKGIAIDTYTGKKLFVLTGDSADLLSVAYSPDGRYIVTGGANGDIKVWDGLPISTSEAGTLTAQERPSTGLAFNQDASKIVTSGDEAPAHIISVSDGDARQILKTQDWVNDTAMSPDGKYAAIGQENVGASIWDMESGSFVRFVGNGNDSILDIEFSADGKKLAGASRNGIAYIWDVSSGKILKEFGFNTAVWSVAFSRDGKRLATGSDNGEIAVFDIETEQAILTLKEHTAAIRSLTYSPDGTILLSGGFDSLSILWDAESGEKLRTLAGHIAGVTNTAFSPAGDKVATSSADGTVKVWDTQTGDLLYTLLANRAFDYFWANNVAFTPNSELLATGSEDGVVRFYYTDVQKVLSLAKVRITRSLSSEECKNFLHEETCPENIIQSNLPAPAELVFTKLEKDPSIETRPTSPPADSLRSGAGSTEVTLNFINNSGAVIHIIWMDFDGIEQPFYDLADGEEMNQGTYSTHAWRLYDQNNNLIFEYVATDQPIQDITINPDLTVTAK